MVGEDLADDASGEGGVLRIVGAGLGEARSWADTGRAAKLAAERDALLGQLRAATGLGGRPRVPARPTSERALPSGRRSPMRSAVWPPPTRRWDDCCPTP